MKKGFTLIELLAVIVILAIIALIAVPIVLNTIEDTRNESQKISVKNYAKAVDFAIIKKMQEEKNFYLDSGFYFIMSGKKDKNNKGQICLSDDYNPENDTCSSVLKINLDGEYPISGSIKIENNKVISMSINFSNFTATMDEKGNITIIQNTGTNNVCNVLNGDKNTVGSYVKCGTEYFYILKPNNSNETVSMLSAKNITFIEPVKQSDTPDTIKSADYYNQTFFESYKNYLENFGLTNVNVGFPSSNLIISFKNIETDGSYLFPNKYDWIYEIEYWVGNFEYGMDNGKLTPSSYYASGYDNSPAFGIRPLVTISKSQIG